MEPAKVFGAEQGCRFVNGVAAGIALRDFATSAVDVSDGLAADLAHIQKASGVGARLELGQLPLSSAVSETLQGEEDWSFIIAGGDDYELCFTLPASLRRRVEGLSRQAGVSMTRIGAVEAQTDLHCYLPDGSLWTPGYVGYDHFSRSDCKP